VQRVDCIDKREEDYMDWLKPVGTRKDKTPEERLYIAKIQTMMEDSLRHGRHNL
jgi:hypothetical protein